MGGSLVEIHDKIITSKFIQMRLEEVAEKIKEICNDYEIEFIVNGKQNIELSIILNSAISCITTQLESEVLRKFLL